MKPAATAALGESLGSSSQFSPNEPRCPRTGEFPAACRWPQTAHTGRTHLAIYALGETRAGQSVGRTFAASLNSNSRTAWVAFS